MSDAFLIFLSKISFGISSCFAFSSTEARAKFVTGLGPPFLRLHYLEERRSVTARKHLKRKEKKRKIAWSSNLTKNIFRESTWINLIDHFRYLIMKALKLIRTITYADTTSFPILQHIFILFAFFIPYIKPLNQKWKSMHTSIILETINEISRTSSTNFKITTTSL